MMSFSSFVAILSPYHSHRRGLVRAGKRGRCFQATAKWSERLRQRGDGEYKDANVRCRVGWVLSSLKYMVCIGMPEADVL